MSFATPVPDVCKRTILRYENSVYKCLSYCPSVRPSSSRSLSRWLNLSSNIAHLQQAPPSLYTHTIHYGKITTGSPMGRHCCNPPRKLVACAIFPTNNFPVLDKTCKINLQLLVTLVFYNITFMIFVLHRLMFIRQRSLWRTRKFWVGAFR